MLFSTAAKEERNKSRTRSRYNNRRQTPPVTRRGRTRMLYRSSINRSSISAIALVGAIMGALCVTTTGAAAWDDSKYPDFSGQWRPIGGPGRFARDVKAPL